MYPGNQVSNTFGGIFNEILLTVSLICTVPSLSKASAIQKEVFHLALKNSISSPATEEFSARQKLHCVASCSRSPDCKYLFHSSHERICRLYSDIFGNTRNGLKGKPVYYREKGSAPNRGSKRYTRLLLVKGTAPRTEWRKLHLSNNSVESFSFLKKNFIRDVTYVPFAKTLLIAQYKKLFASSLEADKKATLVAKIACNSFAVDEQNELIFLTSTFTPIGIRQLISSDWTITPSIVGKMTHKIAVWPSRKIIFYTLFSPRDQITSVTYDGKKETKIVMGKAIYSLAFDHVDEIIFYSNAKTIYKHSINGNITTGLASFSDIPKRIIFHNHTLYVTVKDCVVILTGESWDKRKSVSVGFKNIVASLVP